MGGTLQLLFRYRPGHRPPDIGRIVAAVQQVYSDNNVNVTVKAGADAPLNAAAMEFVDTAGCHAPVFKHRALFDAVAPISTPNQVVIFVVRAIKEGGQFSGCAAFPSDCPGLVITQGAAEGAGKGTASDGKWVLAHEIAHVLGLDDLREQTSSLMNNPATAIVPTLPVISPTERETMESSRYLGHSGGRPVGRNNPSPGGDRTGVPPPRETPSRTVGGRNTPLFPRRRRRSIFDDFGP